LGLTQEPVTDGTAKNFVVFVFLWCLFRQASRPPEGHGYPVDSLMENRRWQGKTLLYMLGLVSSTTEFYAKKVRDYSRTIHRLNEKSEIPGSIL
jgi:hypothetical protein